MSFLLKLYTADAADFHTLKGYITDIQSQEPVSDALIEAIDQNESSITGANGHFEINLAQDTGILKITSLGYKTQLISYHSLQDEMHILMSPDVKQLNEVIVIGFGSNKRIQETAGGIAFLNGDELRQGSGVSLQNAFNSVPGVRMDQSTLSEARISIRGNGVRAQYGIRNIKIYINDIPMTEADGTTRIEGIDVNDLGHAEILKGPASSIYGGGTGGVINFKLERAPYQEQSLEISTLAGSHGLIRVGTSYKRSTDKMNSYVSYGWQKYNGYREHAHDKRNFVTANFQFFPSKKQTFTVLANRTSQNAQIPGALTLEQFKENPKQASPTNLDKQAGRKQNWTRIGIGQNYRFNDYISNTTSIFTYTYDLNHPLPYAYIRNFYQSFGGRTKFDFNPNFRILKTKFVVGAEYNHAISKGTQYVNNHGEEGDINSNTDSKNTVYSVFYQSSTDLGKNTGLTFGVSLNGIKYFTQDYLTPSKTGTRKFKPQASPRVALSHTFGDYLSLHGSVSTGFSPPTGSEIRNIDGTINTSLNAEKAINYEINAKGNFLQSRFNYDLALFLMNMKGELIGQNIRQGITIYHNSGKTRHSGVELALSYQILRESDQKTFTSLRPYLALTYSGFKFEDYKILNADNQVINNFDGNKLTGIAPWVIDAGIEFETRPGVYGQLTYYYSDRLPLNDANTDFNDSYNVLNLKIGYQKRVGRHFDLNIYAGVDNLTNTTYSSMNAINANGFGGPAPYYNPSPRITAYGGIQLKYTF